MAVTGTGKNKLRMSEMGEQRITADKREIRDFPKLPSATSFIRKTLDDGTKNFIKNC